MKRIFFLLITSLMAITLSGCKSNNTISEVTSTEQYSSEYIIGNGESMGDVTTTSTETDSSYIVDWSDFTVNGLDEDSFVQKLDTDVLQEVAAKLQSLVDEERTRRRKGES